MRQNQRLQLLLGVIPILVGCVASEPAADTETPIDQGYVEAPDRVQLFYRTLGAGRDTVVVLHGGPGFTMYSLFDDLAPLAASHTLLFYDQRGTGRSSLVSDSTSLDAERYAEDLEAIRTHFGLDRLRLLAHSWGAAVAALYAHRSPERIGRLVVVDGTPLTTAHLRQAFEMRESRRDSANMARLAEAAEARRTEPGDSLACRAYYAEYFVPFYGDPSAAARSGADFCSGPPEALRNKVNSVDEITMASVGDWDWRPAVGRVMGPALVIHGTRDVIPMGAAREWAAELPNGRLLRIEGAGHFPYVEAPEAFFPAVEAFLRGEWPQGAEVVEAP
jgi:proline iminopeptidase